MKTFLLALCLTLTACASTSGPDLVPTDGAIGRQIERVLVRHDDYVLGDAGLDQAASDAALHESDAVRTLVLLPEVRRSALGAVLAPVADRHDSYVRADVALEQIEVDTYLASTAALRRVLRVGP